MIVLNLNLFETVENDLMQKLVRHDFFSFDTLIKYLHNIMSLV